MIIRKEHAIILQELWKDKESEGYPLSPEKMNEDAVEELIVGGFIRKAAPSRWLLTYNGAQLTEVIDKLTAQAVSDEEQLLSDPTKWSDNFRFLGSEIINLLDAADKGGRVGPEGESLLLERGLADRIRWEKRKTERVELTEEGKQILDIYRCSTPLLEIDASLADTIRELPVGPTESNNFPLSYHVKHKLENMRLLAYSQPYSEFAALTALGQTVKKVLEKGGFAKESSVLNPVLLKNTAKIADGEEVEEESISMLQALGYVDREFNLLPAGELALEVFRIYTDGPSKITWSFALDEEEGEIIKTIEELWKRAENNPVQVPTFDMLRHEMVDRKVNEYKEMVKKYGRYLKERPKKKQEIIESLESAADYNKWYDANFDLRAMLHSLESFNLIRSSVDHKGKEVFYVTDYGEKIKEDQEKSPRLISSKAVKAITLTRKEFSVPNSDWVEECKKMGLLGSFEPTAAGRMYAKLAEEITRAPFLTNYELRAFKVMPAFGLTENEIFNKLSLEMLPEQIMWALDKLEARGLIERLIDGNVVKTEAGRHMQKALKGVPEGLGMPVNPLIYRVIKGLAEVGSVYETEKRIRIAPKKVSQAIEKSGLSRDAFQRASEAARVAGFIGKNSVNEAGQHLLKAVEAMNKDRPYARYAEI